ncbi:MAG: (2Fe-2S)-binding protein, partial [Pseudomonadales bacterium]
GKPRAPYCMMGVCFECLVEIDGVPNCQSCRVSVKEGMQICRQQGAAKAIS